MTRRKKTKTSPVSWRLDDDALNALAILESQEPGKERSQIVGEHLIKAAGAEPTPTIQFNELSPSEILHLRAELAENRRIADGLKIALRKARPNSKEEAKRLSEAIIEATLVLKVCLRHDKELRELARNTGQITVGETQLLEWTYERCARNHEATVKKLHEGDAETKTRAEGWAKLAKFCLIFRPDLGPELKTPVGLPAIQKTTVAPSAPTTEATNPSKPR
jgi:hypothetical protein